MIEAWGENVDQDKFIKAIEFGVEPAYTIVESIRNFNFNKSASTLNQVNVNSAPPIESDSSKLLLDVEQLLQEKVYAKLYDIFTDYTHDKLSRDGAIMQLKSTFLNDVLKSDLVESDASLKNSTTLTDEYFKYVKRVVRQLILDESKRVDGRKLDELRQISCQVDLYNSLHGSALFQRGQTQVLCSVTFDSPDAWYRPDTIFNMMSPSLTNFNRNFMLHYEFPSFATNEISRMGGRSDRREVGHGALAGIKLNFRSYRVI